MNQDKIQLTVYGAEVKCASCIHAPGSKETYEWLQAAISRKYSDENIKYNYFDIYSTNQSGIDHAIVQQILDEEWFYPLVLIEGEVVGEGNPRLKTIYKTLDTYGVPLREQA